MLKTFINKPATVNYQGGKAYEMPLKEKVVSMLCLGLIQGNYYEDEKVVIEKTKKTYEEALKNCPQFLAKAAIYARNDVGMKLQPQIALVYLSTLKDKTLFKACLPQIVKTPKDLHDFIELCRKSDIRGGVGRSVKKAVNDWLNTQLTEYFACRYGGKLAEVMKVTRPIPLDAQVDAIFKYVSKGEITSPDILSRAVALEAVVGMLNKGIVEKHTLSLIKENGLQLEELKHTFGNLSIEQRQKVFEFFLPKLSYMALVSNLVTIERTYENNVPKNIVELVAGKLNDVEAYKKSRMLPFRMITAREMTNVRDWQRAIERVVSAGVKGAFDTNDSVRVAVDTSGSMTSMITPSLNAVTIASIFGATTTLGLPNSTVCAVADRCEEVRVMTDEVFTLAEAIKNTHVGYGTQFQTIMPNYKGEKYVVLISDGMQADNLEASWIKANKPAGAKLIVWQLVSYQTKISNRSDVIYLYGYSERLLQVIRNIIEGKGQLDDIEKVVIGGAKNDKNYKS